MLVLASTCYIYGITEFGTLLNRMGFSDLIKHADYFCLFVCVCVLIISVSIQLFGIHFNIIFHTACSDYHIDVDTSTIT